MTYKIEIAKDEDLSELMRILWHCFEDPYQAVLRVFFPILNNDREASLLTATNGQRQEYKESYPELIWLKVVDKKTDKIIAGAKWYFFQRNPFGPKPGESESHDPSSEVAVWYPEGVGRDFATLVMRAFERPRVKMGQKEHSCIVTPGYLSSQYCFLLNIIFTLPEHRSKGIGRAIMDWGLAKTDELGLETWLNALPLGFPLYHKVGFLTYGSNNVEVAIPEHYTEAQRAEWEEYKKILLPVHNAVMWRPVRGKFVIGTKAWIYRKLTPDDYVIIGSIIFEIAQVIATSAATAHGYGEHIKTLSEGQLTAILKSQYAAQILSIVCLASSKISFVMFLRSITAAPTDRMIALVFIIALSLWGFVSIITVAFQCQPPPTWDYLSGKCYDRQSWQNFFSASNIATEVAIISHTLIVIARIQTRIQRKLMIGVIAATIAHIVVLNTSFGDPDVTYSAWAVSVTDQLILISSIITACSAHFKPFLDSLRSSGMRLDALTDSYRYKSQRDYGHNSNNDKYASKQHSINLRSLSGKRRSMNNGPGASEAYVSASGPSPDWDAASTTSQSRIIREVRTFAVTEEPCRSSDVDDAS
ncbi:hypothetical protein PISL3812_08156 [Talaromyces islandicus]|uniref:Rhodopsin domain-containing protein n=1 Tax=Talaromyces islandicus TaxID=28573 RepID=A0A0U1M693_TALIS|nr:hypothetical protein PISL3812_08156 [Talaromyces islandicus]